MWTSSLHKYKSLTLSVNKPKLALAPVVVKDSSVVLNLSAVVTLWAQRVVEEISNQVVLLLASQLVLLVDRQHATHAVDSARVGSSVQQSSLLATPEE